MKETRGDHGLAGDHVAMVASTTIGISAQWDRAGRTGSPWLPGWQATVRLTEVVQDECGLTIASHAAWIACSRMAEIGYSASAPVTTRKIRPITAGR